MDQRTFRNLPRTKVAQIMCQKGPKVCVFPLNGTRRWYALEHAKPGADFADAYLEMITTRLIELCQLLFDYGVDTLLIPVLSPYLFQTRGERYTRMTLEALTFLTSHAKFLDFYQAYDTRVRFYGDYHQYLAGTPQAHITEQLDQISQKTAAYKSHRLLWGVCAHDAVETIATMSVEYYTNNGQIPDKPTLIEMYYGERIPPVSFFISSSKLRAFDMPLLSTGREDLYYSVAPSPYLTEQQLQDILYDHLFARQKDNNNYDTMQPEDWETLRKFYQANIGKTLGVGTKHQSWGLWYPTSQVLLPEEAATASGEHGN